MQLEAPLTKNGKMVRSVYPVQSAQMVLKAVKLGETS